MNSDDNLMPENWLFSQIIRNFKNTINLKQLSFLLNNTITFISFEFLQFICYVVPEFGDKKFFS